MLTNCVLLALPTYWTEYLATAVTQFMTTVLTHPGNQIRFAAGSPQHTQLVLVLQGIYNLTHCRWLPVVVKIEVETCIKAFFDMFRERKLGTHAVGCIVLQRGPNAQTFYRCRECGFRWASQ